MTDWLTPYLIDIWLTYRLADWSLTGCLFDWLETEVYLVWTDWHHCQEKRLCWEQGKRDLGRYTQTDKQTNTQGSKQSSEPTHKQIFKCMWSMHFKWLAVHSSTTELIHSTKLVSADRSVAFGPDELPICQSRDHEAWQLKTAFDHWPPTHHLCSLEWVTLSSV